jgi:hypothetical protein
METDCYMHASPADYLAAYGASHYHTHDHVLCVRRTAIKTARITFLSSPEFKANLERQARTARVSLGELIRSKFDNEPSEDESLLIALTRELQAGLKAARGAVAEALAETQAALAESRVRPDQPTGKPAKRAHRRQPA